MHQDSRMMIEVLLCSIYICTMFESTAAVFVFCMLYFNTCNSDMPLCIVLVDFLFRGVQCISLLELLFIACF